MSSAGPAQPAQNDRKAQGASFGSFGNAKGSDRQAVEQPPVAAARQNSSMANDLSNGAARSQAMRTFDDRQRADALPGTAMGSRSGAATAGAAPAAIGNAPQSNAAVVAPSLRQVEAPRADNWGGASSSPDASASFERGRRIQAERLAAERQRELVFANARANRAQAELAAGGGRSAAMAPSATQGTSRVGMGAGLAAGAVAGAAVATAATAQPSESDGTGNLTSPATTVADAAGTATTTPTGESGASPLAPLSEAGDSGGSLLISVLMIALAVAVLFWAFRRSSRTTARYSL